MASFVHLLTALCLSLLDFLVNFFPSCSFLLDLLLDLLLCELLDLLELGFQAFGLDGASPLQLC